MRGALVLAIMSMLGCKEKKAAPTPVDNHAKVEETATTIDFIVAKPTITKERIPERFKAPIPFDRKVVDDQEKTFPPYPYMEAALEADTDGMRSRLLTSIRIATAKGPAPEDIAIWYPRLIGYAPSTGLCAWIVSVATGTEPPRLRSVFWRLTEHCRDPEIATRMTGDEVPDERVIEAYSNLPTPVPFNPRVARAAATFAKGKQNQENLEEIGFAFANMTGPEALAAFQAIHKTLAGERAARAAAGLVGSVDPAMRALGEKGCEHPVMAKERICTDRDEPTSRELERGDTGQSVAQLVACAKGGTTYEAAECLMNLADKDRSAAVAIAKTASTDKSYFSKVAADLRRYPDAETLPKYLASIGITPAPKADKRPAIAIEHTLEAYGRLEHFDTETGQFPNEHDSLLARLAALASPALDGVVFEELPPADDRGPYKLFAYSDRQRFEVTAENNGDWYDLEAVIGLLNAVLVNRSSPYRFVVLPTGDQTARVLAGPQAALARMVADGAIEIGEASAAMKDGKAFEDKVIEQLQREGYQPVDGD